MSVAEWKDWKRTAGEKKKPAANGDSEQNSEAAKPTRNPRVVRFHPPPPPTPYAALCASADLCPWLLPDSCPHLALI